MAENKLPEGVGKKIVEALKKQSEIAITPIPEVSDESEVETLVTNEVENMFVDEEPIIAPQPEVQPQAQQFGQPQVDYSNMMYQAPPMQSHVEPVYQQPMPHYEEMSYSVPPQQQYREPQPAQYNNYMDNSYSEPVQGSYPAAKEFTIPANVAVLKRLISQLPQGVSKQTGAQIIRQTMEALGISMSTVLNEAQSFQDGLNTSVRDCVSTIQEYKNNIKNLEKQVSDYQKQSAQVNDLISLFIMTDK